MFNAEISWEYNSACGTLVRAEWVLSYPKWGARPRGSGHGQMARLPASLLSFARRKPSC